jgi:hypothetical protein
MVRKTRSYSYWLRAYDQTVGFRLDVGSEPYVLWNYLMDKHRDKKNRIKLVIEEVLKMARDRIGVRGPYASFVQSIMNEVGGSQQKAFDRIFELALERYLELQHKGQVPILIPHRVVTPRTEPRAGRIETPSIERKTSLNKIKTWFPNNLRKLLTFEVEKRKTIIRLKEYPIPRDSWIAINNIVENHKGKWISEGSESRWEIPLK